VRKLWLGLALVFLGGSVSGQTGDQFIVISKAPKKARIAIPAFRVKALSNQNLVLGEELSELLGKDLEKSGLFEVIPREAYLRSAQMAPEVEDWQSWSLLSGQALVRGELTEWSNGQFELTLKLFDVAVRKNALAKVYKGPKPSLRRMMHRFADETIDWLTGQRGGFESRIAFASNQTGRKEIYVSDSDGFNPIALTATKKLNLHPAWLDQTRVYFVGYDRINPDLYLMDISTKQKALVSGKPGLNISPAAGPAGKKLAYAMESPGNNLDIYVANPDGTKPLRLTSNPANDLEPAWSPDGHYLAFVSDRAGGPQIYMMDMYQGSEADGNRPIRLTSNGQYNTSPAWSPDGRYLAFSRRIGSQFDLFLMDFSSADKKTEVQLTATAYNEEDPCWGPDGRMLVYSTNRNGNYDIYMISIYGKEPVQITDWSSDETQPAWSSSLFEEGG
jgi:TolB protein